MNAEQLIEILKHTDSQDIKDQLLKAYAAQEATEGLIAACEAITTPKGDNPPHGA